MRPRPPLNDGAYHFITLPNTGIQICRGFPLPDFEKLGLTAEELWQLAARRAEEWGRREIVRLVAAHIACNPKLESPGWIACDPNEMAFFRLTRTRSGMPISADLVIDTHSGAGRQTKNRIDCLLEKSTLFSRLFPRQYHLASFYVEDHVEAQAVEGSLIMDFGNSGCSFIFSETGSGVLGSPVVLVHNPFDAEYSNPRRTPDQQAIFKSSLVVLRASENPRVDPWLVMGARSEELVRQQPLATYLFAPKKYVRDWPEHLKAKAPSTLYRGVLGQRPGLHPTLHFVEQAVSHLLQLVLSSLTNPLFTAHAPKCSPMFQRIMLTYPLTWREADKALFRGIVEQAARALINLPGRLREAFQAELVCSEPVAVAAYVLWEMVFQFGTNNLALAGSTLGNTSGTQDLRILVIDIGGGSTDIALVQVGWSVRDSDHSVDVTFKLLESMRFNRAGDRLSHLLATAILYYLRRKYQIAESLDFEDHDSNPVFALAYRRQAISELSRLAEQAKVAISRDGSWALDEVDEAHVLHCFEVLEGNLPSRGEQGLRLEITHDVLRGWVEGDQQSRETGGEPGFIDIFRYLEELRESLEARDRLPHLAVLSGRTTRLPFIQDLTAGHLKMPLHRIRILDDLLPASLKGADHENIDKLAVVRGAQRFRFGDNVRFVSLPDEPIFNRHIGTVRETPRGLELNTVFIRPGTSRPRSITLEIEPGMDIRIGHAFRENSLAEVIANLSNRSRSRKHTVTVNILDDFSVQVVTNDEILLSEWVPGGSDIIVDNFNDTGRIDREPPRFLEKIIRRDEEAWITSTN